MKEELRSGATVGEAIYRAGFNSSRGAYELAVAVLGMTPGEYMNGGNGHTIAYATCPTQFGQTLVARTRRGICAVFLGEHDTELEDELRREFPEALLVRDEAYLRALLLDVLPQLKRSHPGVALPLDLRGTAFQLRVWKALRAIPYGETHTYAEVAEAIGSPRAARAVAAACAANRTGVIVPCHRVVRSDGHLGDYRWGTDRKRDILAAERSESPPRESSEITSSTVCQAFE